MQGFDFADIEIDAFDMSEFESPAKKNPLRQNRYMKPKLSKKVPEARVKYKNAEKMLTDVNGAILERTQN